MPPEEEKQRLIALPKMKMAIGAVVVAVLAVLLLVVYEQFVADEGEAQREASKTDLLAVLRENEISWDDETIALWEENKVKPLWYTELLARNTWPRFSPNVPVMKVGDEVLYTDDFNEELFVFHNPEFVSGDVLSDALLLQVAEDIVNDSVILQEGKKNEFVILNESEYGALPRDYEARNIVVNDIIETVVLTRVTYVEGESITAWFYNAQAPEMGVESARKYALELITDLRSKVIDGTLTMEEAGESIKNDSLMQQIDRGLSGNAYTTFGFSPDDYRFHDPEVQETILEQEVDVVSDIIVGKDQGEDWYDAYFKVVLLYKKTVGADSYDDWLNQTREKYEVTVLHSGKIQ